MKLWVGNFSFGERKRLELKFEYAIFNMIQKKLIIKIMADGQIEAFHFPSAIFDTISLYI